MSISSIKTAINNTSAVSFGEKFNPFVDEFKDSRLVRAANTTELQAKSGADSLMVMLKGVGIFTWSASDPGGGATVYPAFGGGFWVLEFAQGGASSPPTLEDPTGFSVGSATSSSLTISWNPVTSATHYILERGLASDLSDAITIAKVTGSPYVDNGRAASTHYYYRLRAIAIGFNDSDPATDDDTTSASNGLEFATNQLDAALIADGVTMDTTMKNAVNGLVIGWQVTRIWHRLAFPCYIAVGSAANAHKYNPKDPRDADNAYRATFSGTITHNANGMQGDGTSGIGLTHFSAANFKHDYLMMMIYARTISNSSLDMGAFDANGRLTLSANFGGSTTRINDANLDTADTAGVGLTTSKRIGDTVKKHKAGVLQRTTTTTARQSPVLQASILGENGTTPLYSAKPIALVLYCLPIDDDQELNNHTVIQQYQTALSRQV